MLREAQQKDKIMTTLACDELTDHDLYNYFEVKDGDVFARVNALDCAISDSLEDPEDLPDHAVPGIVYCGAGVERVAFYDAETNLVYKRLHVQNARQNRSERRSLYKLHEFLKGSEIRYADTWYTTTDLGVEYQVQEYVEGVGESRTEDFKDEWHEFLLSEDEGITGFREDLFRGNFACNVGKFALVLIDMLA